MAPPQSGFTADLGHLLQHVAAVTALSVRSAWPPVRVDEAARQSSTWTRACLSRWSR